MNLEEIQDLIKFVSKSGVEEVEVEKKDFKITIKSDGSRGKKKKDREEPQPTYVMPQGMMPQMPQQQMPQQQMPQQQAAPQSQPQQNEGGAPAAEQNKQEEDESKYETIKSPMIGTFYRSSSPEKPPFVSVGDTIKEGDVICIVEAMKLFNEIESEVSGKVVKVIADDASPVEYDQPLLLIDPS